MTPSPLHAHVRHVRVHSNAMTHTNSTSHTYTETKWSDVMLSDTIKTVDQIYESVGMTSVCIC